MCLSHSLILSPIVPLGEVPIDEGPHPGFAGNAVSFGSETTTASALQAGEVSSPSPNPIQRSSTSSGATGSKEADLSLASVSAHTGSAPTAPVSPVTRLSSYPTQATDT